MTVKNRHLSQLNSTRACPILVEEFMDIEKEFNCLPLEENIVVINDMKYFFLQ